MKDNNRIEREKKNKFKRLTIGIVIFFILMYLVMVLVFVALSKAEGLPDFKIYRSKKLGVQFEYPKILKVKEKDGAVIISHQVDHQDPCFSVLKKPRKEIFDFYVQIKAVEKAPHDIVVLRERDWPETPDENMKICARLRKIILPETEEHYFKEIMFSLERNFKNKR